MRAPSPSPRQLDLPIDAPGAPAEEPAPSITQAQAEAMERILRGEQPVGYYRPSEGVAPWMES
jgi:hypothetical protein